MHLVHGSEWLGDWGYVPPRLVPQPGAVPAKRSMGVGLGFGRPSDPFEVAAFQGGDEGFRTRLLVHDHPPPENTTLAIYQRPAATGMDRRPIFRASGGGVGMGA